MLLATFLIAVVTPLCDWSCSAMTHCASDARFTKTSFATAPQPQQTHPACCHHLARSNSSAPQNEHEGQEPSHPPCHSSCCPDTTIVKLASGLQVAPLDGALFASLEAFAVMPAPMALKPPWRFMRDALGGTQSTSPAPHPASILHSRAPPTLA
jgi:hypothetical protein